MKDKIKFLLFIIYATAIFFLPNHPIILIVCVINTILFILAKIKVKDVIKNMIKLLPFIVFTAIINCILSEYRDALWIGIKLLLVCSITFIYSKTTTVKGVAKTISSLCAPLKYLKIDVEQIEILICISLSMIPILKMEYTEVKEACKAKNMSMNIKNVKKILAKFFVTLLQRANQIDEALLEKGYNL